MPKSIYFVAGEASGDNHGAALMRALRQVGPDLFFTGRGGPQMKALATKEFHDWINYAAVVGLWDVLKSYGYFRRQFAETLHEIHSTRPSAVVLIDYPGFNLRLARALSHLRPRPRILYYISPQVWAWNRGRIRHMARWLDLMLCIFPFEAELYNKSGLRTIFVGHPIRERLEPLRINTVRDPNLVALLPGSRRREIRKIFPVMLETALQLRRTRPQLRFEIAAASSELAHAIERHFRDLPNERQFFEIKIGQTADILQRAAVGMVASGSATLESAYFGLPFVLLYKVSWLTYFAGRCVVRIKYLGMPNVLANRLIAPEFIQHRARADAIAEAVGRLLDDPAARAAMAASFDSIIASLGEGDASRCAASAIMEEIAATPD